jgi:hypothetical protein
MEWLLRHNYSPSCRQSIVVEDFDQVKVSNAKKAMIAMKKT